MTNISLFFFWCCYYRRWKCSSSGWVNSKWELTLIVKHQIFNFHKQFRFYLLCTDQCHDDFHTTVRKIWSYLLTLYMQFLLKLFKLDVRVTNLQSKQEKQEIHVIPHGKHFKCHLLSEPLRCWRLYSSTFHWGRCHKSDNIVFNVRQKISNMSFMVAESVDHRLISHARDQVSITWFLKATPILNHH